MRKKIIGCMLFLCVGALVSGGCAKKEMVKGEQPVPAVRTAPTPAPETAKPAPAPVETQVKPPMTETPAKESAVQPEAAPVPTAEQLQSELQKVYFDFDSSSLSQDARNVLSKDAELLSKNPSMKVRIEGNCDERGSDEYNMALGERRAKAAEEYLVNLGVAASRLSVISYGEEKPADPGHNEAAYAKNRRDEFVVIK